MFEDIRDARNNKIGFFNVFTGRKDVHLNGKGRVGYIEELNPNEYRAFNSRNQLIAKWRKFDDCTYDANNRKIGKGNLLLEVVIQNA